MSMRRRGVEQPRGLLTGESSTSKKVYQRLAPRIGRNNALYRAASMAKEVKKAITDVENRLLGLHCEMPGRPGHKYETWEERWQGREADNR